ncbi:hypothetical protein BDQ17DRAFT_1358311 [Cyathus striatus]|nr:hypothetical protein BDQ17DRAFT_1358311 [Cyathus striatus]
MPSDSPPLPLIPEILRLICEEIDSKSTLASLARTCKAFEHPALDVLWSTLVEFYPLAKCLPAHLLEEKVRVDSRVPVDRRVRYIVLRKPLVPGDCQRLSHYAGKVRAFSSKHHAFRTLPYPGIHLQVDVSVFQGIQLVMQNDKLFPKIQCLTLWSRDNFSDFSFAHLFMGPRLNYVDLLFNKSHFPVSFFSKLRDLYPTLKHLAFTFGAPNDDESDNKQGTQLMSKSVCNKQIWQNLEYLGVPNLTYEALLRLSWLPALKQLRLGRWRPDVVNPRILKAGGFLSLQIFLIDTINALDCIPLFKMMDSSPIVELTLTMRKTQDDESYKQLFTAISKHCRHDTLKIIHSRDGMADIGTFIPAGEMLKYESIKPLLGFPNIEIFRMEVARGFYVTDSSATKEMATSWKNLIILDIELVLTRRSCMQSTITLNGLLPFAEHCRNLRELGLFFDATDPPDVDDQDFGKNSQTALTRLYVGDSPARFPDRISFFLASCFPALELIDTVDTIDHGRSREHQRIENMVSRDELVWKFVNDQLLQPNDLLEELVNFFACELQTTPNT